MIVMNQTLQDSVLFGEKWTPQNYKITFKPKEQNNSTQVGHSVSMYDYNDPLILSSQRQTCQG